ncbi:MAG: tetratricopeptide repeat protein [Isosphaeraceae bacterium]
MSPHSEPTSSSIPSTFPATKKAKERSTETHPGPRGDSPASPRSLAWLADAGLVALFLALTFLLGVFPLKDADIYWHLRTGDWIRQMGQVPRTDLFTYTREGVPWIDLHWIFQVAVSWLYEQGGVVALNLAKCAVTCVAVLLLVTSRRREWPVWVMLVAWLPALLVLGGRMYVRPETLTLLYLSIFLAVVSRWDRYPYLTLALPIVQVAWVNSQGLFVLGPIILVFALFDAVLKRGGFALERRRWWKIVGIGSLATFAACLINPYGLAGALYPIELAGTMSNPIFSQTIAELTPVPEFIRRSGIRNLPLQLHLATMALGALSFVVPLFWRVGVRFFGARIPAVDVPSGGNTSKPTGKAKGQGKVRSRKGESKKAEEARRTKAGPSEAGVGWRLSPFRLLLFAAFSFLSLQATRNSHQFAAVVGSVTAWNFGEWAAAIRRRRLALSDLGSKPAPASTSAAMGPRIAAAVAISMVLVWVGSGWFYEMTGEKRTISLGEDTFFFPHEATRFAGRPEMPDKFLSFHNGHAALFEFYHGPERKVYTDPRLEVAGAEFYTRYQELDKAIRNDRGWQGTLDQIGRPVILVDHEYNAALGANLYRDPHWRCVWFDPIAAVYVHDTAIEAVRQHAVDFAARHFRPEPSADPRSLPELTASAMALRTYHMAIITTNEELARPLAWVGLDEARRIIRAEPDSPDGWKVAGQIELFREPSLNSPRFRLPFDPVFDLSIVRATYALRRGWESSGSDFTTLWMLNLSYERRLMYEAALPATDRLMSLYPINQAQLAIQLEAGTKRAEYLEKLGTAPSTSWRNLAELDPIITRMLSQGRAEGAADLLEKAYPPDGIPWAILDRIATLRLHLGEPARARALWQKAAAGPESAVAMAWIGATYFAEGDFEAARRSYLEALQTNPELFEACYSLALLEQDAGDATKSYEFARKAITMAPNDLSRTAARKIAESVAAFARKAQAPTADQKPAEAAPR